MRKRFLAFVLPVLLVACSTTSPKLVEQPSPPPQGGWVEQTIDLGSGFRRVVIAEAAKSSFESVGHFGYLYYKDLRLCRVGNCSVSPSGKFAIYQDGPSGIVFLFRREDAKVTRLTNKFIAYANSFDWHESENLVDVYFEKLWKPKRVYSLK
jgi:hypothetical protein